MPVKPRSTVTGNPDSADRLAVRTATPPASANRRCHSAKNVTVGGGSSSVIVVICCCVPLSVPLVTLVISTITVSLLSSSVSLAAVMVTVPVRLPAGITICSPEACSRRSGRRAGKGRE